MIFYLKSNPIQLQKLLKFIYSEKATKFCEISTLLLSYVVPVKCKVEISQNFVAFSEYMNFSSRTATTTAQSFLHYFQWCMADSCAELWVAADVWQGTMPAFVKKTGEPPPPLVVIVLLVVLFYPPTMTMSLLIRAIATVTQDLLCALWKPLYNDYGQTHQTCCYYCTTMSL